MAKKGESGIVANATVTRVRGGLVELTDELLDSLADRFLFYKVRDLLGITFMDFLTNPEYYVRKTCELVRAILGSDYRPQFAAWDDYARPCFCPAEDSHA